MSPPPPIKRVGFRHGFVSEPLPRDIQTALESVNGLKEKEHNRVQLPFWQRFSRQQFLKQRLAWQAYYAERLADNKRRIEAIAIEKEKLSSQTEALQIRLKSLLKTVLAAQKPQDYKQAQARYSQVAGLIRQNENTEFWMLLQTLMLAFDNMKNAVFL
jgi:hypothetical protein